MKKTLVDLWRVIWQERPVCIVMVTNLKEGTKSKCEQYWPDTVMDHEDFGPFTVTLKNEQVYPDYVIRNMAIRSMVIMNVYCMYVYACIYYRLSLMIVIH